MAFCQDQLQRLWLSLPFVSGRKQAKFPESYDGAASPHSTQGKVFTYMLMKFQRERIGIIKKQYSMCY